jgi:hypothetical protein
MSDAPISDWQKGGLRYTKLTERVPEFLAPATAHAFFVAVRNRGGLFRLVNPFTVLQREYVIAATTDGIVVLKLRRPGVFRATIAGKVYEGPGEDVAWHDGTFEVAGSGYQPIAFHSDDAERVAELAVQ